MTPYNSTPYDECYSFALIKNLAAFNSRLRLIVMEKDTPGISKLVVDDWVRLRTSFDDDLDLSNPTAFFVSAVTFGKTHELLYSEVVSKLETARKHMRRADHISWLDTLLPFLRECRSTIYRQIREITPVHVALQRHMAAFVKPLSGEGWRYDMNLQNMQLARDQFFSTGSKEDLEAYLKLCESLTDVVSPEKLGAFRLRAAETTQELAELEVAALMTF